ncbi:MAG: hypothetical protein O2887_04945 [Bacteroidetes bacterium]|nr:hypothetical protein [Bacteroidota bacterium]MDA1119830.1 hypothetical protein [Bacteroidota bacterium]
MNLSPYIFSAVLFFLTLNLFGQVSENKVLADKYLEEAKILNQKGRYDEANIIFRKILSLSEVIPSELCYHFAETLYGIGQYQNSKNFVDKYFELTGSTGDNYAEVKMLEEMVDNQMIAIKKCDLCDISGYRLIPCEECNSVGTVTKACHYCKGYGVSVCTKCHGEGVLITENSLGVNQYYTCDRCNGDGMETCPICSGEKMLTVDCPVCYGSLKQSGTELCDHRNHDVPAVEDPYVFEKSSN